MPGSHTSRDKSWLNGSWIQTHSSNKFFPLAPEHEESVLDIGDIAHSLSMQCRFNGHTQFFFSVAQHCCEVCDLVWAETKDPRLALWGLLHDAAEAYLTDLPKPIKEQMPQYKEMENKLLKYIIQHYELKWPQPQIVSKYDIVMLMTERDWLLGPPPEEWTIGVSDEYQALPVFPNLILDQKAAKNRFLFRFKDLTKMIGELNDR